MDSCDRVFRLGQLYVSGCGYSEQHDDRWLVSVYTCGLLLWCGPAGWHFVVWNSLVTRGPTGHRGHDHDGTAGLYFSCCQSTVHTEPASALHFAAYTQDLDEEQRDRLQYQLARVSEYLPKGHFINITDQGEGSYVFPLKQRFDRFQGLLLIHGQPLPEEECQSMTLLLQQLSTTIANKLLSLELKSTAERDALTGIYNRGRLEQEIAEAQVRLRDNADAHFSVILIDLVGLKPINDQYGHIAGDQLICSAADALCAICREDDRLFRFGGDEFVILCMEETGQGARALMQRIQDNVRGQTVSLPTDQGDALDVHLELSVGLASSDQVPPNEVLKCADERMYADKKHWYARRARYR